MKKSLASGVGVAAALLVLFGASANANPYDPYVGQTYDKASSSITSAGGTAVIATREGSYLPTEQCIVTGSRKSSSKYLLDLNCNDTYAGKTGHPGNSAATPEGQAALKTRATAKSLNDDFAAATAQGSEPYCKANATNCANFCQGDGAGLCSSDLMAFLGL